MNNWKTMRLELASTGEFPKGSVSRVFLVRLPLDDNDLVDEVEFNRRPQDATARRHWSTEPDENGFVIRKGPDWALHCDGRPDRLLLLKDRPLRLGQHVCIAEPDGTAIPFRIASVR